MFLDFSYLIEIEKSHIISFCKWIFKPKFIDNIDKVVANIKNHIFICKPCHYESPIDQRKLNPLYPLVSSLESNRLIIYDFLISKGILMTCTLIINKNIYVKYNELKELMMYVNLCGMQLENDIIV